MGDRSIAIELVPGGRYGRYRLEERLGSGGLAEVWRATDFSTGRVVAVKRFTGAVASGDAERLRAELELLAAHALHGHANVVDVFGGSTDPEPHVVMEYLDGGDLGREIARAGRLSIERTLEVGAAVANALSAASDAGVVHGDVKPSNILLSTDGAIKLADFNVARVTGYSGGSVPGAMLVSFAYAAPEVWEGSVTGASDLYALGCVLYECLAGHPPFTGSYASVFRAHMESAPDLEALPADTPAALRELIGELLEKAPARRPADAHSVAVRLADMRTALTPVEASDLWPAFGPWQIEAPHPVTPWAWFVRHRQSGSVATVELFFGDQALGEQLRRAVEANARLVPLGAETLIETNRLLLRPDQSLGRPTPPGWIFWVARDEQAAPPVAVRLDGPALSTAVERIRGLMVASASAGLVLDLSPANLVVHQNGHIHVRRPGIAPVSVPEDANALATLRQAVVPGLFPLVARAASLAQLQDELSRGESTAEVWGAPQAAAAATIVGAGAATVPIMPIPSGAEAATTEFVPGVFRERKVQHEQEPRSRRAAWAGIAGALLLALGLLVLGGITFVLSGGLDDRTGPTSSIFAGAPPGATPTAALGTPLPFITPAPTVAIIVPTAPPATVPPSTPIPTQTTTEPPPDSTPQPPPPSAAWRVSLESTDTQAENGELVSFTATAGESVSGTPYVIQIFNPASGFVHRQCGSGTTCSVGGRREDVTVLYQARVSAPDGSDVQAQSEVVTVTWSAAAAPEGWSIEISSSQQTAANGERVNITATTNRSVNGTGFVIQIISPNSGFVHRTCRSGSTCTVGARRQDVTADYEARVSELDGSNVQAQSERIYVTWQ